LLSDRLEEYSQDQTRYRAAGKDRLVLRELALEVRMESHSGSDMVARLMTSFRQGDRAAAGKLVELFYPELRRLAAARMRGERMGHSWQPTLLVNELYLELIKIKGLKAPGSGSEAEKAAFFGLAAHLMKRLLAHHARPLYRRVEKVPVQEDTPDLETPGAQTLSELEDLLSRLGSINPRLRTVAEMKVFHGLTMEQIAARMDCAPITAKRYWSFAKQWLADEMAGAGCA
jgi:RNA polymerase sigma factor (TIGR02999 family)